MNFFTKIHSSSYYIRPTFRQIVIDREVVISQQYKQIIAEKNKSDRIISIFNQAQRLIEKADEGVSVVLRYNPHSLNVYDVTGAKIDWYQQLKGTLENEQCVPVEVRAEGESIEGTVHACRLPPA